MIRAVGVLIGGMLAALLCSAGVEQLMGRGDELLLPTVVAAAICLVPSLITLVWALRTKPEAPLAQLQMVVMSSMVRMGLTAAGGLVAYFVNAAFQTLAFLVALLGFYMLALALETRLLVANQARRADNAGR